MRREQDLRWKHSSRRTLLTQRLLQDRLSKRGRLLNPQQFTDSESTHITKSDAEQKNMIGSEMNRKERLADVFPRAVFCVMEIPPEFP
jgi:hypothetical protein